MHVELGKIVAEGPWDQRNEIRKKAYASHNQLRPIAYKVLGNAVLNFRRREVVDAAARDSGSSAVHCVRHSCLMLLPYSAYSVSAINFRISLQQGRRQMALKSFYRRWQRKFRIQVNEQKGFPFCISESSPFQVNVRFTSPFEMST